MRFCRKSNVGVAVYQALWTIALVVGCSASSKSKPPATVAGPIYLQIEGPCPPALVIDSLQVRLGGVPRSQWNGVSGSLTVRVTSADSSSSYGARVRIGPDTNVVNVAFAGLVPSSGFVSWTSIPPGSYWVTVDGFARRSTHVRVAIRVGGVDTVDVPTQYLPICGRGELQRSLPQRIEQRRVNRNGERADILKDEASRFAIPGPR
jgi:hypothetical protein